ncbi:MAG: twin-arginine translocase subunit TatC [Elusimicrobia bacterium]|nr:twin-arginine translocase subunit TatC [Elusimicrobiota bacterium]
MSDGTELVPEVLPDDKPQSVWEHVGELRERLVRSMLAVLLASMATYVLRFRLWALATRPLTMGLSSRLALGAQPFAYTDLAEPFMAMVTLSFWTAVFLVSPYVFYQVWAFVRPALRARERGMATTFVVVTSGCFILGALFAYFYMFGTLASLLMEEAVKAGLRPMLKPTEYLNLFLYTVVGSGVAFEAPVLFYFLARFGMANSRAMLKYWREATVAIMFVSGFCTPGDVVATMIVFGVVLSLLYYVSVLVVWLVERSTGYVPPPVYDDGPEGE